MYILVALITFGILVAVHELGHFLVAKACGVKVNEFAIGMGPALIKKQGKETLYSLRLLPLGGYCAMEGEDEESDDPRSFSGQKAWKKLLILVAGSFMNFLMGFIIIVLIFTNAVGFASNTIDYLEEGFKYGGEDGLMAGDTIEKIDGERIIYSRDFSTYMSRSADGKVDMVIRRGGERLVLEDYDLAKENFVVDGKLVNKYGINFEVLEATAAEKLRYSVYSAYDFVRLVKMGLSDLITGAVGLKDMSGVVGIVSTISDVGENSATTRDAIINIAYLCAFIAINLAVMNMLPIPALDGGRVFFLAITWLIEKLFKKKLDPKYEGYIHTAGLVLLLVLMAYVMFNDIMRIVNG